MCEKVESITDVKLNKFGDAVKRGGLIWRGLPLTRHWHHTRDGGNRGLSVFLKAVCNSFN